MKTLLNPDDLLATFGYIGLFLVVFAESGLLIGFFLPGDSLLFTAGLFTARPIVGSSTQLNIAIVCIVCAAAAVTGDQVGYLFGRRVGPSVFRRPNSRIFKQKYVEKSQAFFDIHGAKTILLARFVPIVRTFGPILAGVGRMNYRTFITYNVAGGVLWGVGVPLLGHSLGNVDFIAHHFEVIAIIIVAISVVPVGIELLRVRLRGSRKAAGDDDTRRTTAPRP
jgi:membrane-associated protein